jgi:hypothetical protein
MILLVTNFNYTEDSVRDQIRLLHYPIANCVASRRDAA